MLHVSLAADSGVTPQKRRRTAAKEIFESMDLLEEENDQLKTLTEDLKTNNDQLMKEVIKLRHVDLLLRQYKIDSLNWTLILFAYNMVVLG